MCPTAANPYCVGSGDAGAGDAGSGDAGADAGDGGARVPGTCGRCATDADCAGHPGGAFCSASSGACGPQCTQDSECNVATQWCSANVCVGKTPNGQPVPNVPPINGACSPANGTRVCAGGACETSDNTCGLNNGSSCTAAGQCRSNICSSAGKCSSCANDSACAATEFCDPNAGGCRPRPDGGTDGGSDGGTTGGDGGTTGGDGGQNDDGGSGAGGDGGGVSTTPIDGGTGGTGPDGVGSDGGLNAASGDSGGCSCRSGTAGAMTSGGAGLLALGVGLLAGWGRRRRRR